MTQPSLQLSPVVCKEGNELDSAVTLYSNTHLATMSYQGCFVVVFWSDHQSKSDEEYTTRHLIAGEWGK